MWKRQSQEIGFGSQRDLLLPYFQLHFVRLGYIISEMHFDDQILAAGCGWGFVAELEEHVFGVDSLFVDYLVFR